jgi:uncharacterized protein
MNDRTCIVTRKSGEAGELIRFVAGPDGSVVPDLKRKLPGRGCWVTATRAMVDQAVARKLFARGLKEPVTVGDGLGEMVDGLLARAAVGSLGMARKAGRLVMGAAKVEASVRSGEALAVLHALEAQPDGVRKIDQARRATVHLGGPETASYKLFSQAEMGLALGGSNVIHAAVLAGGAGETALERLIALDRYRGGPPVDRRQDDGSGDRPDAAEDTE